MFGCDIIVTCAGHILYETRGIMVGTLGFARREIIYLSQIFLTFRRAITTHKSRLLIGNQKKIQQYQQTINRNNQQIQRTRQTEY